MMRAFAFLLALTLFAADTLPPKHRQWLERDAVYIIIKEERDLFLRLPTDADRDRFIERFWEVRNPSPGSPVNPYREEHYRRLAYANQTFGREGGTEGWRTDMGRTYITLGPPQQRAPYKGVSNLRPFEIWFYATPSRALPPYFSVVFYQKDTGSDYRFYSPYGDGPEALVTPASGVENRRVAAWRMIDRFAGREVSRTILSLIADEPVDIQNATSSLQSDVMLGRIRNLANDPVTKAVLERRRQILENVSSKVLFGEEFGAVLAVPLRDSDGNINLHYALRVNRPEDFAVAETNDGRYYYSVQVAVRVFGAGPDPLFTRERAITRYLDKKQLDQVKGKAFSFESWLPLAPGKYRIEFVFTNSVKHTGFRAERQIVVPDPQGQGLQMTPPVAFSDARTLEPGAAVLAPFSVAGVRFEPQAGSELRLEAGSVLKLFYQVWKPAAPPQSRAGKKLLVEYAYGRPAVATDRKVIRDEVPEEQFDAVGSLVNGKRIPLPAGVGNYILTITVTDPETQKRTYGTLRFQAVQQGALPEAWTVTDEETEGEARRGVSDYQRGLCWFAADQKDKAIASFRRAFELNPEQEEARNRLVDLYFAKQAFAELNVLAGHFRPTVQTPDLTILRLAEGVEKSGNAAQAIELLEAAIRTKTSSGPLYLALASYYRRQGKTDRASELERQGRALMANPSGL